ncbi:uncharacterized protein METZ01_LOCUS418658, partial [marine metagenome]
MVINPENVVVCDHTEVPETDHLLVLWNGYKEGNGQYSVLKTLEKHSDQLRSEYLALIYELCQLKVAGKRIVEHLEIEPDFSLWWMTLLAEKSPYKTKAVLDSLRLMAIRRLLVDNKIKAVELISVNPDLALAMERLCASLRITFSWSLCKPQNNEWSFRRIWKRLPP